MRKRAGEGRRCGFIDNKTIVSVAAVALMLMLSTLSMTSGCASAKGARRAHLARADLTGITRSELESCAGQPLRVSHTGSWEYLTYASPLSPDQDRSKQCVATFMVRNGYVEGLDYENPNGRLIGQNIGECLAIVNPCLPPEEE